MTMITKMYYSREDRVAKLNEESDRLDYHDIEQDIEKTEGSMKAVLDFIDSLEAQHESYVAAAYDEGSGDEELDRETMLYHRSEMVYAWAMAQAALSKFAWVHRIDGNKAYEELMSALDNGNTADMRGL